VFFEPARLDRFVWECPIPSEYGDLLLTHSGHRALEPSRQTGLLEWITGLIDTRYRGRVTKQYMTKLRLARRRP
jgi:hypothetical protein